MRADELVNKEDIIKEGNLFVVTIPVTKTRKPRKFVADKTEFVNIEKYQRLRPSKFKSERFFLQYRNGKCLAQVIRKKSILRLSTQNRKFLPGLNSSENYTGNSTSFLFILMKLSQHYYPNQNNLFSLPL